MLPTEVADLGMASESGTNALRGGSALCVPMGQLAHTDEHMAQIIG